MDKDGDGVPIDGNYIVSCSSSVTPPPCPQRQELRFQDQDDNAPFTGMSVSIKFRCDYDSGLGTVSKNMELTSSFRITGDLYKVKSNFFYSSATKDDNETFSFANDITLRPKDSSDPLREGGISLNSELRITRFGKTWQMVAASQNDGLMYKRGCRYLTNGSVRVWESLSRKSSTINYQCNDYLQTFEGI